MVAERPIISSTSGLSCISKCLVYVDKLFIYLLFPSTYIVSKANDDFPDPLTPVITINLFFGIDTSIFLRLCSLAPFTKIKSLSCFTCVDIFYTVQNRNTF